MKSKISWLWVCLLAIFLWASFGSIPYMLDAYGIIDNAQIKRISPFGGIFGAAEAFFSGFALIAVIISIQQQREALALQAHELKLATQEMKTSADAQTEMARHQKNAISLEVIMPCMNELASEEMRQAIISLSSLYTVPDFAVTYKALLNKRKAGTLDDKENEKLENMDRSRRRFSGFFHKIQRLARTGVVDDKIVKVVIGPDHCWLLLNVVEPLEQQIRANYSTTTFDFARRLYSAQVLEQDGKYR